MTLHFNSSYEKAMTKIKLCGLSRPCDIEIANQLKPDYIGFVFAPKSKRYVTPETAGKLKKLLNPAIQAVGVFTDADLCLISSLLSQNIIDIVQLHGKEKEDTIKELRLLTKKPVIRAYQIQTQADIEQAKQSIADYILLDAGAGTGTTFDWRLIQNIQRPYFLAGGLTPQNAATAIQHLTPYALDVSSGIESNGNKDPDKMAAFVAAVRKEDMI